MEGPLAGKTALVTGASRGIGAAIARRLAGDGAAVAVHFQSSGDGADRVVAAIRDAGGRAFPIRADLADPAEAAGLVDRAVDGLGGLDMLVNNAGTGGFGPLADVTNAEVARILAVNLTAPILTCRAAARCLADGGRIVNIGSVIDHMPVAGRAVYGASKGGVHALTAVLAQELGVRGITVNAVAPGVTETDRFKTGDASRAAEVAGRTALGRIGRPGDIAALVAFLCGPDAAWITGTVIDAHGGLRGL